MQPVPPTISITVTHPRRITREFTYIRCIRANKCKQATANRFGGGRGAETSSTNMNINEKATVHSKARPSPTPNAASLTVAIACNRKPHA